MFKLSSVVIRRKLVYCLRSNCNNFIANKTFQSINANKLEKTLNFNKSNTSAFPQRLNQLELCLRKTGRIFATELNQCLNELSKSKRVRPTTTQCLQLIRCCGALLDESPQKRQELCEKMFKTLSETVDLDISHYNQLLRVYVENEFDFNVIEFLEKLQSKGIDANRVTYILMIDRFCQTGDISEAIRILEYMKSKDLSINEAVFNSLIVGYGKAGDLETAYHTIDIMKTAGIEPTADTYTALLCAYASNIKNDNKLDEKINKLFEEIKQKEIEISESNLFKVVKAIALVDSESKILEQILSKIKKSINYNKECLNVVRDLIFANRIEAALKLYDTMDVSNGKTQGIGKPLIRSMLSANVSPQTVIEFCERLEAESKNIFALKDATEMALSLANVSDCRTYLERLGRDERLKIHYFFPVIVKCEDEYQIINVLVNEMSPFIGGTYSQLSEMFVNYIWPKNIKDYNSFMEKCKDIGFSYVITYNSLIKYLIENNRLEEALKLMSSPNYSNVNLVKREVMNALSDHTVGPNPNINNVTKALIIINRNPQRLARMAELEQTDHFGQFLLSIIRRRISQNLLNEILREWNRRSVKISGVSANAIRDRISLSDENENLLNKMITKTYDDYRGFSYHDVDDITKPRREMTPEELEGHLIELRSKGLNARGVLRSLFMSYCRRSRFTENSKNDILVIESQKRVKQIVAEMIESNYEFTNAMYASLMEFYVNCGNIESALEAKSKISKEFEIDSYKIINFATLYVKSGQTGKAIDLIRAEYALKSDTMEAEEESHAIQNRTKDMTIYRLLNSLIEAKADFKQLKEVFELCIDYSDMTPTGIMAGPLVKYHVLNENFAEALTEYVYCAEKFQITPWKNQLIHHFIERGDQISLQTVVDYSNKIHGEMNTIIDLASVCFEAGKIKQARKLLDTPGLRVSQAKMDMVCEHFIRENKIDALEQFIRCSKNLFDVNRDRMLYHLIRGCIKLESPEKALNCWTLMQEENIQPSDTTLHLLADYLKHNNVTVPFAVPPEPIRSVETPHKLEDNLLNKFNSALKSSDIDEAIRLKKTLESEGKTLLMSQNCLLMEALLNADRIDEAFDMTYSFLESKLFPSPRIVRYLFTKLSSIGDYERLEKLRPLLPDFLTQNNAFTNAVSIAYINSGKTDELIDKLANMKPFPLGAFLRGLELRPDLEEQFLNIATKLIREQDYHLPMNMVWINCMKMGRFEDAKRIYDSCPKLKDFLLFSSLLDSIRENKNLVLAKKLIETVIDSNVTPKSIGVTYSALIDTHLELGQIREAEDVVVNEVVDKTNIKVKHLEIEHLNRSTVHRLIKSIREREQREPRFATRNRPIISSSSDDSNGGTSSDEEVLEIKDK